MIDLYNEDCFDVMEVMNENEVCVDLILTDPPYELNLGGGAGCFKEKSRIVKERHIKFISDGFDYFRCFEMFLRLQKVTNILIFCSNAQISKTMSFFENLGLSVTLLVWHKTNAIPLCNNTHKPDLEFIVYVRENGAFFNNDLHQKKKTKLMSSPICADDWRFHPTQKPEKIIYDLIEKHSRVGDTIFDPFMGSGVVGKICAMTGRNFYGCEIREDFFKQAERIIKFERDNNLFN